MILRVLDPIKTSPFVVPTIKMMLLPIVFPCRRKPNFRGSKGHFQPNLGGKGMETPPPVTSQKPSSTTSRRSPVFFQKRLANKQIWSLSKNTIERVGFTVTCSDSTSLTKEDPSNILKHTQHFSTCRKVKNGNSRVHKHVPNSRGMGIVDRPIRCLPSLRH